MSSLVAAPSAHDSATAERPRGAPAVARRRLAAQTGGAGESRFWGAIVRRVLSRPALSLVLACGLLLALAIPVFALKIGTNGISTLPDRFVSKQGYLALQKIFPGATPTRAHRRRERRLRNTRVSRGDEATPGAHWPAIPEFGAACSATRPTATSPP